MSISNTIDSYRKKRKQPLPLILGGAAILLVIIGIIILVVTMSKDGFTLFPTQTPTPTITPSRTSTFTPTETSTITLTPTITSTPTASQIFQYVVKEGETLTTIIQSQGLADTPNALIIIFMINPTIDPISGFITVGQTINLPPPGFQIPTPTPLPTGLAPGAKITYRVLAGDSLGSISTKFNSTIASLLLLNKTVLTNGQNSIIYPGQLLTVSINLVTPVPTVNPTATAKP